MDAAIRRVALVTGPAGDRAHILAKGDRLALAPGETVSDRVWSVYVAAADGLWTWARDCAHYGHALRAACAIAGPRGRVIGLLGGRAR